jgi:AraC-like DNA-binding protein
MLYLQRVPAPPLSEFIAHLWHLRDTPSHPRERILPGATIEIVINLNNDEIRIGGVERPGERLSGAVVPGPYGRPFDIDAAQHASIMGVHFRPGGALPFLGVPLGELTDRHIDLCALWGAAAAELRSRLCEAPTPAARFDVLERALVMRLRRACEPCGAVAIALASLAPGRSAPGIGDIAGRVGLSHRRLIEVFTLHVGMTPKLFSRVQRFRLAIEALRRAPAPDWARLALRCGYCDQSHLIRDFTAFARLTPTEYFRRRSDAVKADHVALAG